MQRVPIRVFDLGIIYQYNIFVRLLDYIRGAGRSPLAKASGLSALVVSELKDMAGGV